MKVILDRLVSFFKPTDDPMFRGLIDRNFEKIVDRLDVTVEISKNFIDATAHPVYQLPDGFLTHKDFFVVKTDSSGTAVVVTPRGTQTIEGSASLSLSAQYSSCLLTFNKGVWYQMDA